MTVRRLRTVPKPANSAETSYSAGGNATSRNVPSAPVTTSTDPAPSPTSRSARTVAAKTGPPGPTTVPEIVAPPGCTAIVVVVRPATPFRPIAL